MRLLGFSPATNIWVHAYPEALVLDGVRAHGFDVVHIACGGLIDRHCVAMEEAGLGPTAGSAERAAICRSCTSRARLLQQEMDLPQRTLAQYVTVDDRAVAQDAVAGLRPSGWTRLEVDGIPVGRLAAYEFLLKYKVSDDVIPEALWPIYLGHLHDALLVNAAVPRLLDDVQPDAAVAYNTLYSMNRVFKAHCEQRGIPCYSLQGGAHLRRKLETLTMFRDDAASLSGSRSASWQRFRGEPIGAAESAVVMESVRELFAARSPFVYSAPHKASLPSEVRIALGLQADRRTALVALSSRDEMFAADTVGRFSEPIDGTFLFPTQLDWIEHVMGIARRRDDLQFIVRVHPREFPNKRESVLSPNVARLEAVLQAAPSNVAIDWPSDGRGIYDVLQVCDVVLSGWSSVGAESALFGLPVVIYDTGELLAYPAELATVVERVSDYEAAVDAAIRDGVTIDRVIRAFRWYAFAYTRLAVDLSAGIPPRSVWSARRVLQGLRSHTRVPVPLWPILGLERREVRTRRETTVAAAVLADTLRERRASVAESTAWPEREKVSLEDEHREVLRCVDEMIGLLGSAGDDPTSLTARLRVAARI